MSIDSMLNSFKDLAEVKAFAEAQTKTILELNKKLRRAEEEILHLKQLSPSNSGLILSESSEFSEEFLLGSDQETIAKVQLSRLKESSFQRELTLEEARKVDTYTKILQMEKEKPNKGFDAAKLVSSDKLLELVDDSGK